MFSTLSICLICLNCMLSSQLKAVAGGNIDFANEQFKREKTFLHCTLLFFTISFCLIVIRSSVIYVFAGSIFTPS